MKSLVEKEEIKKILQDGLVELNDPGFTENIIKKYIEQKERKEFTLFWSNDLVYAVSFVALGICSLTFWLKAELSNVLYKLNISAEHTILITVTAFVFLIGRFLSEYLIKNALPDNS